MVVAEAFCSSMMLVMKRTVLLLLLLLLLASLAMLPVPVPVSKMPSSVLHPTPRSFFDEKQRVGPL
jgi:hypothetical protein